MKEDKESILSVEEAIEKILSSTVPLYSERISINEAAGRVLFKNIISDENIPPFDNSAMDGYAIIATDTINASADNPVQISIIDEIRAGGSYQGKTVKEGTAIRIMTGAPIPAGADAVIKVEDTSEKDEQIKIFRKVKKIENIRYAGEDIKKGSTVLKKGDMLKSADIGLLASLNITEIDLYRKPEVAIISTGDEVVEVGGAIKPGQIRNSNSYTLMSETKKYNSIPHYIGIAKDDIDYTRNMIIKAMQYDVIITTGGVSMGKYDFVKDVIKELGFDIHVEKLKMKPGKPCVFAKKDEKLFFGLPGNPVSTLISFIQFVRPALLTMMGAKKIDKPVVYAELEEEIRKKPERKHFIRGYYKIKNGSLSVNTTGPQGSGILKSMSIANCLIILPIGVEIMPKGEKVLIQLINHEEI